jgi:short-subunit dehydrogenase
MALARVFAANGVRVALVDRDEAALARASEQLTPRPLVVACDVTDPAACQAAVDQIIAQAGGVDILVNNAGVSHRSRFAETSDDVLRHVMNVNFFGSVNMTRAALPSLRARRGRIAVLSSVAGFAPLLGRTGYAASKHALHGFFDSLRAELAASGVSVTLACPYFTQTAIRHNALAGDGGSAGHRPSATGKALDPDLVAAVIVRAAERRQRQVVIGKIGRLSYWVSRLAPAVYERLMRRSQRAEFGE